MIPIGFQQQKEVIHDDEPKDLSKTSLSKKIPLMKISKSPILEESQEDKNDINGIRVPKMNSHGKLTTYKCKQCDFVATTKVDFWQHSKDKHYRPEKTFYCKFCPFVTELKHHFEYHVNGHTGTKPYKCEQCDYSCVNKSMLNSHMKSHSQIYQYRCKDCLYVSKYCHSLKNHLRKYNHRPSVVLNIDGTENHHQIIDVYGTRRGPRPKLKTNSEKNYNSIENSKIPKICEITPPQIPFPLNPAILNPFMMNEMFIRMALQLQQRTLIAQNNNLIISSANSIHSSENTSDDEDSIRV
nr:protein hunchback-like [Onthophagus taurus]